MKSLAQIIWRRFTLCPSASTRASKFNRSRENKLQLKNSYIYKRTYYKLITLNSQVKHQIIGYQIFNNMNRLNPVHESREKFQSDVKQKSNNYNIQTKTVISPRKLWWLVTHPQVKSVSIMKCPGWSSEDMVDYVKSVARKKPDTLIIHVGPNDVGPNDLTKGVKTMKKIRKCVEAIRELDNTECIQTGFSSIIQRTDKEFSNEIKETKLNKGYFRQRVHFCW